MARTAADDRYLANDERTVLIVRPHIAVLGPEGGRALAAILVASTVTPIMGSSQFSDIFWVIALYFVLRLGWAVLEWVNDQIVITDKRIFELSGVITRNVASMPLRMLTDVTYRRTLAGRLLGYGTLVVESAGQDQALSRINFLPSPDQVYKTITTLVFT